MGGGHGESREGEDAFHVGVFVGLDRGGGEMRQGTLPGRTGAFLRISGTGLWEVRGEWRGGGGCGTKGRGTREENPEGRGGGNRVTPTVSFSCERK